MNKRFYTWRQIEEFTKNLVDQILFSKWTPDYIVGITRGGLVPANLLSQYFNIPMYSLNVSLRDSIIGPESNLWMAEDAFGYDKDTKKNILIVDDINDEGKTLSWIKKDWQQSCLPDDSRWADVWGKNVRFAVLFNNEMSQFSVPINYFADHVNKTKDPHWIVFPWEEWWSNES